APPPAPPPVRPAPPAPAAPAAAPAPKAAGGAPAVTFKGAGTFPAKSSQTICEVAEDNGIEINAECHAGLCGVDPIRILSGAENLAGPPGSDEKNPLEDVCGLKGADCRLACMVKIKGPVEVELIKK